MHPLRLSIVTYNLWNTQRWPQRAEALNKFLDLFTPDILCIQELREETQSFIDKIMPMHQRVDDEFPSWNCEGNIYWNSNLLEELEHGAEDIGMLEKHRRLFWVRLKLMGGSKSIFVSTAHYTYQGHEKEMETGISPRLGQTRRTMEELQRLVKDNEPALFLGDLNDPVIPARLMGEAGYESCFKALNMISPPTYPCNPTAKYLNMNQAIDWIIANSHARPLSATVPHFFYGDFAPSDHWPVLAVYEI